MGAQACDGAASGAAQQALAGRTAGVRLTASLPLCGPVRSKFSLLRPTPRRAQQSCCGSSYIPTDPAAPALLEPWEWGEWLCMCKTGGDIEAALSEWLGGRRSWGVGPFGWRGEWL